MQAGVDHEPPGAEQGLFELAEQPFGVAFVPAGLRRQTLCVKAPPFASRGDSSESANLTEAWKILVFNLHSVIEVMTRNCLVIRHAAKPEFRHVAQATRILIDAWARAVRWRRVVVGSRVCLAERREREWDDWRFRALVE